MTQSKFQGNCREGGGHVPSLPGPRRSCGLGLGQWVGGKMWGSSGVTHLEQLYKMAANCHSQLEVTSTSRLSVKVLLLRKPSEELQESSCFRWGCGGTRVKPCSLQHLEIDSLLSYPEVRVVDLNSSVSLPSSGGVGSFGKGTVRK